MIPTGKAAPGPNKPKLMPSFRHKEGIWMTSLGSPIPSRDRDNEATMKQLAEHACPVGEARKTRREKLGLPSFFPDEIFALILDPSLCLGNLRPTSSPWLFSSSKLLSS